MWVACVLFPSTALCLMCARSSVVCGHFLKTRNIHTPFSPVYLCWIQACVFLYTCANVCRRLSLKREIITHSIRFICVGRLSVLGGSLCIWTLFFRMRSIHTPSSQFICVRLIFSMLLCLHLCESLWSLFLERGITHFIRLLMYLCICVGSLSVWGFCYVCGRLFF